MYRGSIAALGAEGRRFKSFSSEMSKNSNLNKFKIISLFTLKNHIIKINQNSIEIFFFVQNNFFLKKQLMDILYFIYFNFLIIDKHTFSKLIFKTQTNDNIVSEFYIDITNFFFFLNNSTQFVQIISILQNKYKNVDIVLISVFLKNQ